MRTLLTLTIIIPWFTVQLKAQTVNMTPVIDLNLQQKKITIPAKFDTAVDASRFFVNLPQEYEARLFYAGGLVKPRFMTFSPAGVLHVSDMGSGIIYALPDNNNDGIADTAIAVASGFTNNHDIKFYKGAMYVTEPTRVIKLTDNNSDGFYESKSDFITGIPGGGNHITRTIVFDSINKKIYLSIGSSCNVCRETDRAIIEQYNEDGTGGRTYAYGVRNAVGMTLHPVTNRLWANNNGSDNHGDEVPAEWIDLVRDSGFYGHPFAYGNKTWFNFDIHEDYEKLKPITAVDSMDVERMMEPSALIRAHSAPMAIQFLNSSFPMEFGNGFLVALRGSWNTPRNYRGYKIMYFHLSNTSDTTVNYASDFVTGFLNDTATREYWGRPVGLAADNKGRIYMSSDDSNKFVLQIYKTDTTLGIYDVPLLQEVLLYPNPFSNSINVSVMLNQPSDIEFKLFDVTGKLVKSARHANSANTQLRFNVTTDDLPNGVFFYEISSKNSTKRGKLVHVK